VVAAVGHALEATAVAREGHAVDLALFPTFVQYRDPTLPPGTVLLGELRLQEAARLGFTRAVVPRGTGLAKAAAGFGLQLLEAGGVAEALVAALGVNPADDRG
jgi:DNA repair protein RadA/Sms